MLVCWPGKVAPGTRINTPVICEDLFPTLLHLGGVKDYETLQQVEGKDLYDLIVKGSALAARQHFSNMEEAYQFETPESVSGVNPNRDIISHYPHQWKPYILPDIDYLSSIRRGEWKLVYRMRTRELELYNLDEELGEQNNVAAAYPDVVKTLAIAISDSLRKWNACMPIVRATGHPVEMPDELLQ